MPQSRVGSATIRALGGTPVGFGSGAPIAGLDGIEGGISLIEGLQNGRAGGYLTGNVVLWPRPLVVFASREALGKLTPAQRRILVQAVAADVAPETNVLRGDQRTATADLRRSHQLRFVLAGSADLVALRRAVQPVYATSNATRGPAGISRGSRRRGPESSPSAQRAAAQLRDLLPGRGCSMASTSSPAPLPTSAPPVRSPTRRPRKQSAGHPCP
ncbi:MAG TPA: hypothetical protein VGI66_11525 [Streptosporangiaceae bacterium]